MHKSQFKDWLHEAKNAAKPLFAISRGHLSEALASGLGFRTSAAMWAADADTVSPFSEAAFVDRLEDLADDPLTARAMGALVAGYRLDLTFTKRAERFGELETVFDIAIVVRPPANRDMQSAVPFRLPEFLNAAGQEKWRVDADYTHRVDGKHAVTRGGVGRKLLDTELQDGRWSGALFIYGERMRSNPAGCLGSVRAAMARIILSKLITMVTIDVFKPDTYMDGAWRLVMRVGPGVRAVFSDGSIPFALPTLPTQRVIIGTYDLAHMPIPGEGLFVDGVFGIDVHTNGVSERENPVPMQAVCDLFLQAVHTRLKFAGIAV